MIFVLWGTGKEFVFCCWVEWSRNVSKVKLVDSVSQILYILDDYLSTIYYWERNAEISNYIMGLSISPLISTSFCFVYFEALLLGTKVPGNILCSECIFSGCNAATPVSFPWPQHAPISSLWLSIEVIAAGRIAGSWLHWWSPFFPQSTLFLWGANMALWRPIQTPSLC